MHIWTDAKVERLKEMAAAGISYAVIGAEFGVSKSAVSGKVGRLKLWHGHGSRPPVIVTLRHGRARPVARRQSHPVAGEFLGISVFDFAPGQCRFPRTNDAGVHLFCGQPQKAGSSYCPACHRQCHYFGVQPTVPTVSAGDAPRL